MKLHEIAELKNYPVHHDFKGRIVVLGLGSVGQCMVPLLLRHLCEPSQLTILELGEHYRLYQERWASLGIKYVASHITKENLDSELSKYLRPGDFLCNVSLNIDGITLVEWCLKHDVMYIDTSIERWETQPDETIPEMSERTLYYTHQKIRAATAPYKDKSATAIVTHGANPGLVTHFTKALLLEMATTLNIKLDHEPNTKAEWAKLMKDTGTKVIHIAERDTQVLSVPKIMGEFVNTWSCEGFWAEGRAPAELGWGTHEDAMPAGGKGHTSGPKNTIYLDKPGISVLIKSWVPLGGTYNGFLVQHSEAVTISDYFTVGGVGGAPVSYRPTVHYVYQPCNEAISSVHELRGSELKLQKTTRIAKDEIVGGMDELGVLLMGDYGAWWFGSQLDIHEARSLVEHENATSLQVAASMLGAMVWAMKNPRKGYCEPEDLPFREVLAIALPYLGPMASVRSDWSPLKNRNTIYPRKLNDKNPWSFENFQVWS